MPLATYHTAGEQIMGTNPTRSDAPFTLDFSPWDAKLARLSWRGPTNRTYEVLSCSYAAGPLTLITNLPGRFPETEWFTPYTNLANQFFRVRTVSP